MKYKYSRTERIIWCNKLIHWPAGMLWDVWNPAWQERRQDFTSLWDILGLMDKLHGWGNTLLNWDHNLELTFQEK